MFRFSLLAGIAGTICLGLLLKTASTSGQTPGKTKIQTTANLDGVPDDALFVYSYRFADLWRHTFVEDLRKSNPKEFAQAVKFFDEEIGIHPKEIDRLTMILFNPDAPHPLFVVSTLSPLDRAKLKAQFGNSGKTTSIKDKTILIGNGQKSICILNKSQYALGPAVELKFYLKALGQSKDEMIIKILEEGRNHQVFAGVNMVKAKKLVGKGAPPPLQPYLPLLESKYAAFHVDMNGSLSYRVKVYFDEEKKAKQGATAAKLGLQQGKAALQQAIAQIARNPKGEKQLLQLLRKIESAYEQVAVKQDGKTLEARLVVNVDVKVLANALAEAVVKTRVAAARMTSQNNLKQLALAMHTYHDVHGKFPARAVFDKNGKPRLSWRVVLLPYLDQQQLYQQFRLDEPWDSKHNKKLLAKMPKVFAMTDENRKNFTTHYQGVAGKGTIFDGTKQTSLNEVTAADGASRTIMLVEAAKAVPWTKPDDLSFDPDQPIPKLGGVIEGGWNAVLCDGSTRFLSPILRPSVLESLFRYDDGQPIPKGVLD